MSESTYRDISVLATVQECARDRFNPRDARWNCMYRTLRVRHHGSALVENLYTSNIAQNSIAQAAAR
jgi:hypothetical protein